MSIRVVLSVHQLVDFLLRRGSIDNRIYNSDTMQEGTRIHLRYQSIQNGDYESEVPLECSIIHDEFEFVLQGRADGVIKSKDKVIIDEIKSTNDDLEHFYEVQGSWHLGQAICYGYMYASSYNLKEIGIRLTYISQNDHTRLIKDFTYNYETLFENVEQLISRYATFYRSVIQHKINRSRTASKIEFPYEHYRDGQKEVAKYVYKVASEGGLFFFEAPTGTGKTMSTIFPAIKTFVNDVNDKIFYLSAKTQAKEVAYKAMKTLIKHGLECRSIVLSAKDHMCINENKNCNPDECPYALDYYEKINDAIAKVLLDDANINDQVIFKHALSYNICPFEFQLDLSLWCDVIICDYNYLFDPIVYLKRFFDDSKTPFFALIDEAHNLSERTKDMYTMAIEEEKLNALKKSFRLIKAPDLKRKLNKVIKYFHETKEQVEQTQIEENDFSSTFYNLIDNLYSSMQKLMKDQHEYVNDEFTECSRMINRFLRIHDYLNDNFVTYYEKKDDILNVYIRCLDSSELIADTLKKLRGAVFFSATLTPIDYYIKTLGGDDTTPYLRLPSPFPKEHLCLLVRDDISTRYKDRAFSYEAISDSIKAVVNAKIGNYLVFFSSYQYLLNVLEKFDVSDYNVIVQNRDMTSADKEAFLDSFVENPSQTTIGFAVLGGVFSEGIDLVSTRLIGAIVVGVGLPMVSFERDLIKNYYDKKGLNGFDYSYTNPGKNKVMQAAGRVIRSTEDRGVVLLIDQRFTSSKYRDLFRLEWSHYKKVNSTMQITNHLNYFWKANND